jgi:demethylmenaquinone methyltransferase/2-methoxy-6-polyprenyl-1,4-benzoquinol methylase
MSRTRGELPREGGVAIVPEDATEEVAVDPTAAVLLDARVPTRDEEPPDGAELEAVPAVAPPRSVPAEAVTGEPADLLPPPGAGTRRVRRERRVPRPRTGNPVPESDVAAMFDEIAPVYDRLNTVMTLGSDGRWRDAAVAATGVGEGGAAIDVACGTGKLAAALAERVGPFGRVLGVDLSAAMVARAADTYRDIVQLEFVTGSALALPTADDAFDAATISFGLRNLPDFEGGFRELARVVRPGGSVVCLELTVPRPRAWAVVYHGLFRRLSPMVGGLAGHRDAYRYLPASLEGFPQPRELAATMRRAGLVDVTWRRLALGTVALHVGRVPQPAA